MKKLMILIGNGFTIDFLRSIGNSTINVRNLFKDGNCVPWPVDSEPGFLSYKYCPNLWNLGVRPYIEDNESLQLIEEIITCANITDSVEGSSSRIDQDNIYIKAYKELAIYLKHLFIYYDSMIDLKDENIKAHIESWGWCKYFRKLASSEEYKSVTIVTYNYDVWLERILTLIGVKYRVLGVQRSSSNVKFNLIKPHGSISFVHKNKLDRASFRIPYNKSLSEGRVSDFQISYTNLNDNYLINALIPPAGDSSRLKYGWAGQLRQLALGAAKSLTAQDEVILCGISYWHVDRLELDGLFTSFDPEINIKLINPNPPRALNGILTSLFRNYICYTNSNILGGVS
ncbi:hypothetical protein FHS18_001149 [Paenibacillus phyllosphaerae]|uniref:SIR2-like domain-containing protein n=1 Tax=Paenibacillus phyllosphaerae TaxID=274593 RepID=A0A7W5AV01_9BACL|nr:hypothetical protein [Paenibacillus phyllosphaerae]MBB3109097.1 hypothetical protein [Paenibacillus phyllosphaerae]